MPRGQSKKADTKTSDGNRINLGFEAQLILAVETLRTHLELSDEKHVVFSLIFLKSLSNTFEATQGALLTKGHLTWCGIDAQSGRNSTFSPDLKTDFLLVCGA
jgi:type I restriction-modification system DNA methylase subunit